MAAPPTAEPTPLTWFRTLHERACPVCQVTSWGDPRFAPLALFPIAGGARSWGDVPPVLHPAPGGALERRKLVIIPCTTCGYLLHFDSALLGFDD